MNVHCLLRFNLKIEIMPLLKGFIVYACQKKTHQMAICKKGILGLHWSHHYVPIAAVAHMIVQHFLYDLLAVRLVHVVVIKFILEVVGVIFFVIASNTRTPYIFNNHQACE